MRSITSFAGLAAIGTGSVGPIAVGVPAILWSIAGGHAPPPGSSAPSVSSAAPSGPGRRKLVLADPMARVELDLPILAPESIGAPGEVHSVAPGAYLVHAPIEADRWGSLRDARPELIILGNARALFAEGEPFIRTVDELRRRVGSGPLLWAPRVALPHRLALLTYLGVDLLDDTEALWQAAEGAFLDAQFGRLAEDGPRDPDRCDCPGCLQPSEESFLLHARAEMRREFATVRRAIGEGRLRELVEGRSLAEPLLEELLRYADRYLEELLQARTPVVGRSTLGYVAASAFRRPEVVRFRRRFLERYSPPPSKQILLVVPCSRTKPYRNSRSHRRFATALEELPHRERVHVVSVTSPLGLVPRELEDVYPARHYDIPVTGEWTEDERAASAEAVRHLLRSGSYTAAVFHLDRDEYRFLEDGLPPSILPAWSCADGRPTSPGSLAELRKTLSGRLEQLTPVSEGPLRLVREELRCLAAYQFGREAADRLFAAPIRLAGRPWFQRLQDGSRTDLATWQETRGLFQLTVAGGRRLVGLAALEIEVDPAVHLAGDLFGPGVVGASDTISPGDAVLLVRDGHLLGVGEAAMPGAVMRERPRGRAVHVRHRAEGKERKSTEGDLDPGVPPPSGPVV